MIDNKKIQNIILEKFGYPDSLIKEYSHWYWLLRPQQVTLGSSIVIIKEYTSSMIQLDKNKYIELLDIYKNIEATLTEAFDYDKINYLMLMMEDPTLHYHVIPRYKNERVLVEKKYKDPGYPGIPDFKYDNHCNNEELIDIRNTIININI